MKNDSIFCSFIVPVYNVQEYIPACIESILHQTYDNFEVILVNDGSTDNSLQICSAYRKQDERIRVVDLEHGGVTRARKQAALMAKGEYILCVDADDWIENDTLSKLYGLHPKADIYTYCYYEEGDGYKGIKRNNYPEGFYSDKKGLEKFYKEMLMNEEKFDQGIFSSLCNKMIRRDIFINNLMPVPDDIYYGEDTACTFPCLLDAEKIHVTNLALYHYRLRADSCVRSTEVGKENFSALYSYLDERFSNNGYAETLKRQLKLYMWQAVLLKGYDNIEEKMPLFPFKTVESGMKVAVYGAGMFGQVIARRCQESDDLSMAGWFDRRNEVYGRQGLPVKPADYVMDIEFDVMVIAILNMEVAERIKNEFIQRGIAGDKMDSIDMEILKTTKLPL